MNIKNVFRFSLQLLSGTFLILRKTQRDITTNIHISPCKVPTFIVRLQENLNFPNRISKNTQISNLVKICPVGAELFHAGGRTDGQSLFVILETRLRILAANKQCITQIIVPTCYNSQLNFHRENYTALHMGLQSSKHPLTSSCKSARSNSPVFSIRLQQ